MGGKQFKPIIEDSIQYHFPGQNYTGPGTHVYTNIMNYKLPVNKTDFVTMLHDIQYMQYAGIDNVDDIDDLAIAHADYDLPGIATKIGLTLRKLLKWKFNNS